MFLHWYAESLCVESLRVLDNSSKLVACSCDQLSICFYLFWNIRFTVVAENRVVPFVIAGF